MEIRHRDSSPSVDPEAYVAPTAVLSGQVRVGPAVWCHHRRGSRSAWVAVGDPARLYPPGEAENIRAGLEEAGGFLPFVLGTDTAAGRSEQMRSAMRHYAGFMSRSHNGDEQAR